MQTQNKQQGSRWWTVVSGCRIEDGNTPVDSYKGNRHGRHNFSLSPLWDVLPDEALGFAHVVLEFNKGEILQFQVTTGRG